MAILRPIRYWEKVHSDYILANIRVARKDHQTLLSITNTTSHARSTWNTDLMVLEHLPIMDRYPRTERPYSDIMGFPIPLRVMTVSRRI